MKPSILWTFFILLIIACTFLAHNFLTASRDDRHQKAFLFKGSAGLCFVAAGILTASVCPDRLFAALTLTGLILGVAGDQLLALRFLYPQKHDAFFTAGGASFAVGHLLYILALIHSQTPLLKAAVPIGLAGLAVSVIYTKCRKMDAGNMQVPLIIYLALLSVTLATAWGSAIRAASPGHLFFAAGALLFLLSDNFLFVFCFGDRRTSRMNWAVHGTYYAAQLCFALSIGLI